MKRLFEDISNEMKAFIKISIILKAFFSENDTFSRIARLFKYIFSENEAF
jgi:hypothetical protein